MRGVRQRTLADEEAIQRKRDCPTTILWWWDCLCFILYRCLAMTILFATLNFSNALALEAPDVSITPEPIRYTAVKGDVEKYSAHHWRREGYVGGIKDFSLEEKLPEDITVSMEGHALIDENDMEGKIHIEKENFGFVHIEYEEFRKYYDGTGGVYYPFNIQQHNETDKILQLDIGHFAVEIGLTLEELPDVSFLYEREYKDGAKSHLTWTAVRQGAVTRSIGPSWQDIDEIVDVFALRASHDIKGVALKGEQRWEFVRSELSREEKSLSTTAVAADKKIRVQNQAPEANVVTTTLGAEKWFWNERALASAGYRFAHIRNREVESIFEMNEQRVLTNFANPKQVRDARADNDFDSHTWVAHGMILPWTGVSVTAKLKAETLMRQGSSLYPQDTTAGAPDGIINNTEKSDNDNKVNRLGEGISLRFTKIPRTAIYNDLEFEQTRNWLSEDRTSQRGQSAPNVNEIFSRETITMIMKGIWTLGAHVAPASWINLTSQVRHRRNNNDYDDQRETGPGANTARSAFFDALNIQTNEFTGKAALKPVKWMQPAFRYQFRIDDYLPRIENEPAVESNFVSNIFTFDVMLQPTAKLMSLFSFSSQNASVDTPANDSPSAGNTPAFDADVHTWLFSLDYAFFEDLTFTSTLEYSWADNFNDFAATGLPMGVENRRLGLSAGWRWLVKKNMTVEPRYEYYYYKANPHAEFGNYHAHVFSVEFTLTWI